MGENMIQSAPRIPPSIQKHEGLEGPPDARLLASAAGELRGAALQERHQPLLRIVSRDETLDLGEERARRRLFGERLARRGDRGADTERRACAEIVSAIAMARSLSSPRSTTS